MAVLEGEAASANIGLGGLAAHTPGVHDEMPSTDDFRLGDPPYGRRVLQYTSP
jgi:hypothetical protein